MRLVGIEAFTQARDRLLEVIEAEADTVAALDATSFALHAVTGFSSSAIMPVDPKTLLPTGGVVEGFDVDACAPFWDGELLAPGFNKFTALARSTDPVGTLVEATDGDLRRAPLYLNLYEGMGVGDELRVAFIVGTTCWGVAVLLRPAELGPFPDQEIDHVRRLAPLVGRALRVSACKLEAAVTGPAAMIVVGADNRIENLTIEADDLLRDLRTGGLDEPGLPTIVRVAITRARASRTSTHLATRVRGTSGRWLRVTAMPMQAGNGSVAVMIEPARPSDLTPILLESYRLTEREVEIVTFLARGLSTKEIAAELTISAHTVRDHLKAIFEKTSVNSRGELIARLFSEHLLEGFHAAVHRVG